MMTKYIALLLLSFLMALSGCEKMDDHEKEVMKIYNKIISSESNGDQATADLKKMQRIIKQHNLDPRELGISETSIDESIRRSYANDAKQALDKLAKVTDNPCLSETYRGDFLRYQGLSGNSIESFGTSTDAIDSMMRRRYLKAASTNYGEITTADLGDVGIKIPVQKVFVTKTITIPAKKSTGRDKKDASPCGTARKLPCGAEMR